MCATAVWVGNLPGIQIIFILLSNQVAMTYLVYQMPFKLRSKNRQESINEVILDLVMIQLPIFSNWGPGNPEV